MRVDGCTCVNSCVKVSVIVFLFVYSILRLLVSVYVSPTDVPDAKFMALVARLEANVDAGGVEAVPKATLFDSEAFVNSTVNLSLSSSRGIRRLHH